MSILAAFMVPHPPMIVPQVGRGTEAQIEKTKEAYEAAAGQIAQLQPETIIITSPHCVMYSDYFHISPGKTAKGSFSDFGAPEVRFEEEYDAELADEICRIAKREDFPAGKMGERDKRLDHGTMVPLWFVRNRYKSGKIVRIGLSGLPLADHYRLGQMIWEAVENTGRKAVLIASGDLSHKLQAYGPYGYAKEGPQYDERIMDVCGRAAFGELFEFGETFCEKAAECGHRSFVIMAGAFDGMAVRAKRLSHEDVTGVGYGICTFYPGEKEENRHFLEEYLAKAQESIQAQRDAADPYVQLAVRTIENYIGNGEITGIPADLPKEMLEKRAGAFVSIHEHGKLRGCIGTILPCTDCIAQEIIDNALSAATRDPRFDEIRPEELKWLEVNVDILGDPENIDSPDELDVKKYGVIVTSGRKHGLLLPDLDGVDTVEQQISIAMHKAGIREGEKIRLQRFEVVRHT